MENNSKRKFRKSSLRWRLMGVAMLVYIAMFVIMFYAVSKYAGVIWAAKWAEIPRHVLNQVQIGTNQLIILIFLIIFPFWFVGSMFMTKRFSKLFVNLSETAQQIENSQGKEPIDLEIVENSLTSTEEIQQLKRMITTMVNTVRETDEQFRSIVSHQRELIFRWMSDYSLTFINQAFCDFFDQPEEFWLNTPGEVLKGELAKSYPELAHAIEHEVLVNLEFENESVNETFLTMPNGERHWVQWRTMALYDQAGNITECQSIGYVLTDLKRTQLKLEEANYQLTALSQELIKSQEEERIKVARYLHDQVLGELGEMARRPDDSLDQETVNKVIDKLRNTIYMMRSPMLNYGLYMALEDLADRMRDLSAENAGVEFQFAVPKSLARFDRQVETQIYRIVQEASNNAVNHASASQIIISGVIGEEIIDLTIKDDGKGFDLNRNKEGALVASRHYGMVGMEERCKIIGAYFDIGTQLGEGTVVHVKWTPDMIPASTDPRLQIPVQLPEI